MLGIGVATLEFEEADLASPLPATGTTELVAAALLCGYRLLPRPEVNHEDVLVHPRVTRLQQFRDAPRAGMRRLVRFHFLQGQRVLLWTGERGGPGSGIREFRARWESDPAFRAALRRDGRLGKWHDALRSKLLRSGGRVIAAAEGQRIALARTPNFGGSAETARAFAELMERGGIMG